MSTEVHDEDGEQSYSMNRDARQSTEISNSTEVPKIDATTNNDLMSRLSSFLPQIRAANIDLVNAQNQSMLQIDQSVLFHNNEEEEIDEDEDDTVDENDGCFIEENDGIVNISLPNKRIKHEVTTRPATIVMDIHMNQDINDPLFQALVEKSAETDDEDDNENNDSSELVVDGDAERDVHLSSLILPRNIQNPTTASNDGFSKLIEEVNDR